MMLVWGHNRSPAGVCIRPFLEQVTDSVPGVQNNDGLAQYVHINHIRFCKAHSENEILEWRNRSTTHYVDAPIDDR